MWRVLVLLAACAHDAAPPAVATEIVPAATIPTELLATPIRSSRIWTTALAPNRRGGWSAIAMAYELHAPAPPEYLVVDLATGVQTSSLGKLEIYANTNYAIANQVRAPNGRIFFPEADGHLAYYEPADERVHQLDRVVPDKLIFKLVFGPDGQLYGGTQADALPTIFRLDPATLAVTVLGKVGRDRLSFSYAYDLVPDPPWIYVAVGQTPWELAALDARTGDSRVLAKRSADAWIELEASATGVAAKLVSGLHGPHPATERVWCRDGALATSPPPPRDVRPVASPLRDAPEVEVGAPDGAGTGIIRSRARGGAWRETLYRVTATTPVALETLVALPDGTLLGSASQYHGTFRYDPARRAVTEHGALAMSQGVRTVVGDRVYAAGYPNGVLMALDGKGAPRPLGNFAAAGAHYAENLVAGPRGRLYYAGRRERDGIGAGVGWYDPASARFAGHHEQLSTLDPRGLAVVGERIVLSGAAHGDPAQAQERPAVAQLVVFDAELHEVERATVKPGLQSTGELFADGASVVVGIVREAGAIYRYDLAAHELVGWRDAPGPIGPAAVRPADGSIWFIRAGALERLDPHTLALVRFGVVDGLPGLAVALAWQRDELYAIAGPELRRLVLAHRAIK